MIIYHARVENKNNEYKPDEELENVINQRKPGVEQAGGNVGVSWGFGITPSVVVLSLPEGVEPGEVFPDLSFEFLLEAERTSAKSTKKVRA